MPILYGYKNHRLHGVPMRPQRSGMQMQRDVDLRHAWGILKDRACKEPDLADEIERLRRQGLDRLSIMRHVIKRDGERKDFLDKRQEALTLARERGDI